MSTAMGGNALAKPAEKETHKENGDFFVSEFRILTIYIYN